MLGDMADTTYEYYAEKFKDWKNKIPLIPEKQAEEWNNSWRKKISEKEKELSAIRNRAFQIESSRDNLINVYTLTLQRYVPHLLESAFSPFQTINEKDPEKRTKLPHGRQVRLRIDSNQHFDPTRYLNTHGIPTEWLELLHANSGKAPFTVEKFQLKYRTPESAQRVFDFLVCLGLLSIEMSESGIFLYRVNDESLWPLISETTIQRDGA